MLLVTAVILGEFGACFNAIGTVLCVSALVNGWSGGQRSDQMSWVNMVVVMWVVGGRWYKRCR